ncbi:hypothetical protein E4U55_006905 [Claviceps digitariae]|nr:hypothetical protein E4U55_006905 [Claviceps digitariae]
MAKTVQSKLPKQTPPTGPAGFKYAVSCPRAVPRRRGEVSPIPSPMHLLNDFKPIKAPTANFFPHDPLTPVTSAHAPPHRTSTSSHGPPHAHLDNTPFIAADIVHSPLARRLQARHLQMIAISGSIGTGLFILTGRALATGGPASLLLAFAVVGVNMYCTCHALGELAVLFPIAGSFSSWATRFLDPSWGFALGWK